MDNDVKSCNELFRNVSSPRKGNTSVVDKDFASMNSLIAWNISKVLERNPNIDLKSKFKAIQERLDSNSWIANSMASQLSEERHLACAFLAWQKMGRGDASTLYRFIQTNLNKASEDTSNTVVTEDIYVVSTSNESYTPEVMVGHKESIILHGADSVENMYPRYRPISKLPIETKIVMRCENKCKQKSTGKKTNKPRHAAESAPSAAPCKDRLLAKDKSTTDLRQRVQQLAKREEERVKLLSRAEAAWQDLEKGYIRRLKVAEEKEQDIGKQIKSLIEERADYKAVCDTLAKQLADTDAIVQKETETLKKIESDICERTKKKFKISEEIASVSSTLAQHHCRVSQTERDLLFKEDQAKRKVTSLEETAESYRGLKYDTERALRTELSALKDQVAKVSKRLLDEETENHTIKNELDEMRVNKCNILEDLDACKIMCDHLLQSKKTELKTKTEKLAELKEKVLECRCKLPQDVSVEVKRTPSLAAICRCCSDANIRDSCSCASLRCNIMSNILKDLFAGLQSELSENGSVMPCELLKCLEDKHNWDRASAVKTNLRNFFSKLLVGELDIAIGSIIEKYHVKWVGTSCVDEPSRIPNNLKLEEWQQQALENQAQKMAKQLAEQLFQEKADELMEKAKDVLKLTPPPCECGTQSNIDNLDGLKIHTDSSHLHNKSDLKTASDVRKATIKNFTQLQLTQVLDKRPRTTKKNIVKPTKDRTNNKVIRSHGGSNNLSLGEYKKTGNVMNINQICHHRAVSTEGNDNLTHWLLNSTKKGLLESSKSREIPKKNNINQCTTNKNVSRSSKRRQQSYAVNLCLCERERNENGLVLLPINSINAPSIVVQEENTICEIDPDKITSSFVSKNTLPFANPDLLHNPVEIHQRKINKPFELSCSGKDCKCLNKDPSSTSLNKLLNRFRHEEFKTSEFINNESLKNLVSNNDRNVKLQKDIFTNTMDDVKSIKPASKLIDTINPDNDYYIKFPSVSLQINSFQDENSSTNKVSCTEGDINLCYDGDYDKHTFNEQTMQRKDNENGKLTKTSHYWQECQYPESSLKCTNPESSFCNTHTSVQSFISRRFQRNVNLRSESKSSENSFYSLCPVEFLGVTLSNNKNNNVSASTYSKNQLLKKGTSRHIVSSTYCQYTELDQTKQSSYSKQRDDKSQNNDVVLNKKLNCICCNKVDENDDLELNTFELLAEYLQKKLEDFKLTSFKTPNMSPYDEDMLYSDILMKVKKLILDMNDEVLCTCLKDNQYDTIDASWKRASCLLQEYLQNKIKRITCSCTVTIKNSNSVLPGILDKVCQLIEDDFKKLRHTHIDRSTFNIDKHKFQDDSNQNGKNESLNEMLTNDVPNITSQIHIAICNTPDRLNTSDCNEKVTSLLQESDELQKEAVNSSELLQLGVKSAQNSTLPENTSKENSFYCDCSDLICKNLTNQVTPTFSLHKILDEKTLSVTPELNEKKCFVENRHSLSIPYIGYTLDCSCDKKLGPCVCTKSAFANNKNIYDDIWSVKEDVNSSYIMQGAICANPNKFIAEIDNYNDHNLVNKNSGICEKVIEANQNNDGIRLKISTHNLEKAIHNSTNTSRTFENVYYSSCNEWDDCESYFSQSVNEASTNKDKLYDSLHLPIDYLSKSENSKARLNSDDDVLMRGFRSDNCDCELVPICHVKMLIDNIERKLESCKCTCDSLCPKVCPIHYETVSL